MYWKQLPEVIGNKWEFALKSCLFLEQGGKSYTFSLIGSHTFLKTWLNLISSKYDCCSPTYRNLMKACLAMKSKYKARVLLQ